MSTASAVASKGLQWNKTNNQYYATLAGINNNISQHISTLINTVHSKQQIYYISHMEASLE